MVALDKKIFFIDSTLFENYNILDCLSSDERNMVI